MATYGNVEQTFHGLMKKEEFGSAGRSTRYFNTAHGKKIEEKKNLSAIGKITFVALKDARFSHAWTRVEVLGSRM